jgi:hypothetical protein
VIWDEPKRKNIKKRSYRLAHGKLVLPDRVLRPDFDRQRVLVRGGHSFSFLSLYCLLGFSSKIKNALSSLSAFLSAHSDARICKSAENRNCPSLFCLLLLLFLFFLFLFFSRARAREREKTIMERFSSSSFFFFSRRRQKIFSFFGKKNASI